MLPHAASSSSDQIGPGNLAVDTNIFGGVYEHSFYYEHTTTSLCTYSNPMIFKCRTKINSNAVVRWHDTARALKGDPQACSHHYASIRYEMRINQVFYRTVDMCRLLCPFFPYQQRGIYRVRHDFDSRVARTLPRKRSLNFGIVLLLNPVG